MRKSLRNKELSMILFTQFNTYPLTKCWTSLTNIHSHINDCTLRTRNQFTLCIRRILPVQTTKRTFLCTKRHIVLYKIYCNTHLLIFRLRIRLRKIPSMITKYIRINNQYSRNLCFRYLHHYTPNYLIYLRSMIFFK